MPKRKASLLHDPEGAARHAKLRYVSDSDPGIARKRRGRGFVYVDAHGKRIRANGELERIKKLAIPPAWERVWICSNPNGHLQATGHDAKGRKQYRYHERWRGVRDEAKYDDILLFAQALPKLRRRLSRDLAEPRLNKRKVLATVVKIMEQTALRVGNRRYTKANNSYGLTTLLNRHADVTGSRVEFRFRGKGGKPRRATVSDPRLARVVKRCQDLPGQRLFQYLDDHGQPHEVSSTDVNQYIQRTLGHRFTAKEFRTWTATMGVFWVLRELGPCRSLTHGKRRIRRATEQVAEALGNTPAICQRCYVHPVVLNAYVKGALHRRVRRLPRKPGLSRDELALLALFERERAGSS